MIKSQSSSRGSQVMEIRLRCTPDGANLVELDPPAEGRQEGPLRLTLKDEEMTWALSSVAQVSQSATRRGGGPRGLPDTLDPIRDLGAALFSSLFEGRRESAYWRSLDAARQNGMRLVLRIQSNTPELAAIPWEFLHDGQDFVGLASWSAVVRAPLQGTDTPEPLAGGELRMLVLAADITGTLEAGREIERLQALASQYPQLHLTIYEDVTAGRVLELLSMDERWHVLHFIGTGVVDGRGGQALAMMDPGGKRVAIKQAAYAAADAPGYALLPTDLFTQALLKQQPDLRLTVLNACRTHLLAGVLTGAADTSIGMRGDITPDACIAFAEELYRGLLTGRPLEEAIALGRQEIDLRNPGSREWGLPVAYVGEIEHPLSPLPADRNAAAFAYDAYAAEGEAEPDDPAQQRAWRTAQVLAQVYQINLSKLQERSTAYGDAIPRQIRSQIEETEAKLAVAVGRAQEAAGQDQTRREAV